MVTVNRFSQVGTVATRLLATVAALSGVYLSPSADAQVPTTDAAQANVLMARATQRLQSVDRLTASYETITEYATPYKDTREVGQVTLERPGRLRIDTDRFGRINAGSAWEATKNGSVTVTDGKTAWQLTRHPESTQYRSEPSSSEWVEKALDPLPPLQGFFGPREKPEKLRYLGAKKRKEGVFEAVTMEVGGESRTLYLDNSGTVRVVEIMPHAGSTPGTGRRASFTRRTVRLGPWSSLSADDAGKRFAFTPPEDATAVSVRRTSDGLLAEGSVAPDFVTEDATGKPVRLSDFAGKVVVLKFWATWCWSCKQSLPQTRDLAREYGDKDVVVLAVAMWDSRKAFRNWTTRDASAHPPAFNPALRFAFDPQPQGKDAASALYGVTSTPTQFIIGKDGRITAVFAGYEGASDREKVAVHSALALPDNGIASGNTGK